jgi:putative DNA primase/helicase
MLANGPLPLNGYTIERLDPVTPNGKAPDGPAPLQPLDLKEFLSLQFPPREMVLAPWLPVGGLAMLYATRGIGKTHAALEIAFAVATGGPFLRWQAPKARSVLVIDGEMPAATLQERLQRIAEASGRLLPQDLRILASDLHPDGLPDLSDPDGQRVYDEVLGDAKLIVVDNLSTLCRSGRENEAESWLTVQGWALARRREGRAVLFVHHAGKGGGQRGSSRKEDVLNTVIALKRPDDYSPAEGARFEVHFEKTRGFCGPDAEPFEALLTGAGWSMRDLKDVLGDRVVALHRDGLSQREIAAEIGTSASTVNRIIKRAGGEPS